MEYKPPPHMEIPKNYKYIGRYSNSRHYNFNPLNSETKDDNLYFDILDRRRSSKALHVNKFQRSDLLA